MANLELNEKVMACKSDLEAVNSIIEEYKPYIASCASQFAGRFLEYGVDEELSVALMAFHQAVLSYNIERGSFLKFAKTVIYARLVDFARKNKSNAGLAYLDDYYTDNDGDNVESEIAVNKSVEIYNEKETADVRRLEILELTRELTKHNISFAQLVEDSPKAQKTKDAGRQILKYIIQNGELAKKIKEKSYLPVNELEGALGISRKTVERMRKYIIASVIVLLGDYQYIKEYIKL